ncbi:hypothetical protein TIFTF001_000910 [Ficus carica]|uniref:Uncharacterized protein n=1 Tax=Ficus carica TaxID=3494 RepID=A0AA87Z4T2_FICCA|nr:hypothetical protein TIFTF001_000910 [Ficus carica]
MIPACFSQPNNSTSPSNTIKASISDQATPNQNLITCIYQTQLCDSPTYLTLTWSRTLFSHTLTIFAPDTFSLTVSLQPSSIFSFFKSKPSSKSVYLTHQFHYQKLKLYWDFTRAEFGSHNSAEPESRFYLAIACNSRLQFFLGDDSLLGELTQRSGLTLGSSAAADELTQRVQRSPPPATLLSRREHVFGRRSYYASRALLISGSKHEIGIECNGGTLRVKVDGELSLVVKRLAWKFRGNEKIFVGGVEVEFFWDVFNWVNGNNGAHGNGHGVFVFQVGEGGVWPEMVGPEKRLLRKSLSSPPVGSNGNGNGHNCNSNNNNNNTASSLPSFLNTLSYSPSVLQWAEESSDGGSRSSCSSSTRSSGSNGAGFSLLLYAWRKD